MVKSFSFLATLAILVGGCGVPVGPNSDSDSGMMSDGMMTNDSQTPQDVMHGSINLGQPCTNSDQCQSGYCTNVERNGQVRLLCSVLDPGTQCSSTTDPACPGGCIDGMCQPSHVGQSCMTQPGGCDQSLVCVIGVSGSGACRRQ